MNKLDERGLTYKQRVMQIPPVAIVFMFPGIVLFVYVLLFITYSLFPNIQNQIDMYSFTWAYVVFGFLLVGAIVGMIASRYKRDGIITGGTCDATCGLGKIKDRILGTAPLFGGHVPLQRNWNGAACQTIPCGFSVIEIKGVTTTFANASSMTATPVYFQLSTATVKTEFTTPNTLVKYYDACTCSARDTGANNYIIDTTTGYKNENGNIIVSTEVEGSGGVPEVGTNGTTITYGKSDLSVKVTTSTDKETVTKVCSMQVTVEIFFVDTLTSVQLNLKELIDSSTTGLTPASGSAFTLATPGYVKFSNIKMTSNNNINDLVITMKNDKQTQGALVYSVYDSNYTDKIYMQSNTFSTKVRKA